ncbi:MAG: serine protein kinase RIO [Nanohaloarchaea archaeon SW_7_46_7]|nr:MAG: serine protein kinase RIO [Nanohaloarchaea archaeon SW_7_46_7]
MREEKHRENGSSERNENIDYRERWKEESRKMFDSSEARKAVDNVFEHETKKALLKLGDRKVLDRLYGTIESGKESLVFLADTPEGERVLVKIYMAQAGSFRDMMQYLRGDKRFRNVKKDRRSVINEWCKKEYKNLDKSSDVVNCPKPIAYEKNILVMEFIGEDFSPYPKLKDVEIENPEEAFEMVMNGIEKLWSREEIVHGDLSEYNILVAEDKLVWIDFSQGVHTSHPEACELGKRDIRNVANFFQNQGADIDIDKALDRVFPDVEGL